MCGYENWTIKKTESQRTDAFELWSWRRFLRVCLLDGREIKPVNPKGNQPWTFIRSTDAEAPTLWPPNVKRQLIGKDPDARKDWGQEEKGAAEDSMVGWHYWLSGYELEQTPGDSEGQGSLACCSPCSQKELDMTEWLKNKEELKSFLIKVKEESEKDGLKLNIQQTKIMASVPSIHEK